ncbi:hypothetical protein GCM10023147_08560 [Tsukamurella soli]|uniref:Uncharacterized protein n=1 Tax=Tsukamurella soli TaxID=644556 RepID=A0ABP8J789_9ACTN
MAGAAPVRGSGGFLDDVRPLSARAAAGFLKRAEAGSLRFVPGFLDDVAAHLDRMRDSDVAAVPL